MTNAYAPVKGNTQNEKYLVVSLAQNFTLEMCFHVIQSEQITLSTDITDHIVEDHTVVQDHITIKPRTFTMKGLISEKVYIHPDTIYIKRPSELWRNKLVKLGTIAPILSSYISSFINATEALANKVLSIGYKAYNAVTGAIMTINQMMGSPLAGSIRVEQGHKRWSDDRIQSAVIEVLDYCRMHRIPLSVNTGWGNTYDNLYITDISVNQGDTYQESELSVSLKQLRFTDIKMKKLTAEKYNRYKQRNSDMSDTRTGLIDDNKTVWARETDAKNNRYN